MTDKQIMESLKKAHDLLYSYEATMKPVAEELARRKSLAVFGKEGCYRGDLGCFSSGINEVCLHRRDEAMSKTFEEDKPFQERAMQFDWDWCKKTEEVGARNIYISGYF